MEKRTLSLGGKTVDLFPSDASGAPVVCLNASGDEGDQVYAALRAMACPDCSLVVVRDLRWSHDLSPWPAASAFRGGEPFTGGADAYLSLLTGEILPAAQALLPGPCPWRAIAGYSLAGLFAVYALHRTDAFARAASVSGSLWFPGFTQFVAEHAMLRKPDRLYFSVGDRECRTRNPVMQRVQTCTEEIEALCRQGGIETLFTLQQGGHFDHPAERSAAGIAWLLR